MTAKSTAKTSKPKASTKSKSAAKPKAAAAAKPKAAAKTAAPKAKSAAKSAPKAKAASKKASAAKAAPVDPVESVKPLIRVRQSRAFTGKKVTKAELEAITEVARWSGSSRNEQPCRFIALRDQELIRRIADIGMPQTRGLPTATAAVAIVEPDEPERGISRAFDDGRAAERMLIAAHMLGLGGGISRVRQAREFTTRKVTRAELEAITEVARWSGSSRNEQPCRFIAMRDQELIGRIADMALPQTRGLRSATAAVAIVEPDEPERADSRTFDDGRAAERMLIAAHMLGLGGGISRVRADVRDGINKALRLPSNRSVRTIVALGHPTEDALQPQSPPGKARLPREEVIYEECWPDPPLKD